MSTDPNQSVPALTDNELFELQDRKLDVAKEILIDVGRLAPMAFVFSDLVDVKKDQEGGMGIELLNEPHDDHRYSMAILPLSFKWKDMFTIIRNHMERQDPVKIRVLDDMRATAEKQFGEEASFMHIARPLMQVLNMHEKDVQAMAIHDACKQFNSFAFMKVDEAWFLKVAIPKGTSPKKAKKILEGQPLPAEHPDSVEAIGVMLESRAMFRWLKLQFHRESGHPRGEGQIIGFGRVEELVLKIGSKEWEHFSGRFLRLLPRNEKRAVGEA